MPCLVDFLVIVVVAAAESDFNFTSAFITKQKSIENPCNTENSNVKFMYIFIEYLFARVYVYIRFYSTASTLFLVKFIIVQCKGST